MTKLGMSQIFHQSNGEGLDCIELRVIIGRNLRRIRLQQGLSLERLAKRSGVSRAMLGQIETGKSTPTIGLLWKISTSLAVPFASLIAIGNSEGIIVLRREGSKLLSSNQGQFTSRALFPFDSERRTEFYELRLAPLYCENTEAHAAGTRENLVVAKGAVEIVVGSARRATLSERRHAVRGGRSAHIPQSRHRRGSSVSHDDLRADDWLTLAQPAIFRATTRPA
jgi:transcriptional regulator with XRE-family HTH domain